MENKALRFNQGKLRIELVPTSAIEGIASILTYGANKYTVKNEDGSIKVRGDNNWRSGLLWSGVLSSMKRHIAAFERGEDLDKESGLYHIDHAMCNLSFIREFYRTHPEMDDRLHTYLHRPKIALDVDNVICDWTKAWGEEFNLCPRPDCWHFSYDNGKRFGMPKEDLEAFYRKIPRQIDPKDLPFEPHCYVTARSIDEELTKKWIEDNGFPTAPVYTVPFGASKVDIVKKSGADMVIDDSYANFVELNNAGICCLLYDAPHNRRYDVGYKRVMNFEDFKQRFL